MIGRRQTQIATMWHADPTPLLTTPVIPVLTIERLEDAVPLARALVAGGLPVIEVTLRTKAALEAVRAIIAEVPDVVAGIGTVTKPADIAHACDAGADFLVSPGTPACAGRGAGRRAGSRPARLRHGVAKRWRSPDSVFRC